MMYGHRDEVGESYAVVCYDGRIRHEPFEDYDDAVEFTRFGHFCLRDHEIRVNTRWEYRVDYDAVLGALMDAYAQAWPDSQVPRAYFFTAWDAVNEREALSGYPNGFPHRMYLEEDEIEELVGR